MPIRRSALSVLCLVIFGTAMVQGQENDPFAEWDRTNGRNATKRSALKDPNPKAPVTYFSPKAEDSSSTEEQKALALKTAQIRMRERSASGPPVAAKAAARTTGTTAPSAMPSAVKPSQATFAATNPLPTRTAVSTSTDGTSRDAKPALINGDLSSAGSGKLLASKGHVASDRSDGTASGSGIRQAAIPVDEAAVFEPQIRKVSQSDEMFDDIEDTSDGSNPFADFLNATRAKNDSVAEDVLFEPASDTTDDDEKAEALVTRKPAVSKAPLAASNNNVPVSKAAAKPAAAKPAPVVARPTVQSQPATPVAAARPLVAKVDDGPQSPGVTVQWVRRGDFNVGQECDVDLVVQNTSKFVVRSVMTEAVIPPEVEILESTPAPMKGSETPSWTFGELKPGESRTVSLKMIPHERGGVRLDAFVRLTGYSSSEFSVQEPLLAVEVAGPEAVEVGQQVSYVVRVNNPGTGVANNVVIQAAVPAGLEHRSGRILSIEIGTLNPGESRQAKLSVTAVEGGAQNLAVRAIADGDLTDETLASVLVSEPRLSIEIAGPAEQMTGRTSDFRMTVSNAGNVPSANVRAKYRLPQGLEFITADRGGKYSKADHSIEWFVGTLQPNENSNFLLTLRPTEIGELVHQAGVISEHGHVITCDYATTVEGMAALDLKIAASNKQLVKGESVTWEVRIRNTGSRAATNVGMSCELPSGVLLLEADGPSAHIAENGVMVFRSLPTIGPGEEVVYEISGQCVRSGNHRLRLRVASESISEPLIGEESATVSDR